MPSTVVVQLTHPHSDINLRYSRIRFKAEVSARDELLTISLPVNDSGDVYLTEDLSPELVIDSAWLASTQGEQLQRLDLGKKSLQELIEAETPVIRLNDAATEWLKPLETRPETIWIRNGTFVLLDDAQAKFDGYRLFVAAIDEGNLQQIANSLQIDPETAGYWSRAIPSNSEVLGRMKLQTAELGFDGRFSARIFHDAQSIGWAWLLTGPRTFIGVRPEVAKELEQSGLAILLPREFNDPEPGTRDGTLKSPTKTDCGGSRSTPPLDASEEQIIAHAEMFSDDPGPFCQPFKNPERILGEKRFSTILRVDQPEIAAAAGIKLKPLTEFAEGSLENALDFASSSEDRTDEIIDFMINRRRRNSPSIIEITDSPLARAQRRKGRKVPSGVNLIDWESDSSENQAVTVARGHVLEWRIRWRSNGYSLGNVAHSLTLAPRQIKRLMKVDWERRERARRRESLEVDDALSQSTESTRDYTDAVSSELSEWSRGQSRSSTTGAAAGAGFAMPGFVVGGGVTHGSSKSSSSAEGERRVAASEEQKLRDAIRQHGESVRNFESTIVVELDQEESVEAVSETIANPNFCHSLTVVYYEILRHLRVDTELGGVSECLFVPFAITPFTEEFNIQGRGTVRLPNIDRIIKHRRALKRYLREKELRWVFRYLDDYKSRFKDARGNDTVPAGPRSGQTVTRLRGHVELKLEIRSPFTGDEEENALEAFADDATDSQRKKAALISVIARRLTPLAPLLGSAISKVAGMLAEKSAEDREAEFQSKVAPDIARRFVNRLQLKVGNTSLDADFTMQSSYRKGRTHRVAFFVSASTLENLNLSRDQISNLKLTSEYVLPIYSVADVTLARIRFSTEHYRRSASTGPIHNDLVVIPQTIIEDDQGRLLTRYAVNEAVDLEFPPSAWEEQNLREQIDDDIQRLAAHLDDHRHFYHKAIWWRMDRDQLYTLLDGYVISEQNSRSIASVVERRPIAILGNSLVFRVARAASISNDPDQDLDKVLARYEDQNRKSEPMRISLPTGGLYAQALMDECEACEQHYGNTDWVLERDELIPQELDSGLLGSRRSAPENLTPSQLPDSLINIQNAPAAPSPTGLQGALDAVGKADSFRDMAGLAGTQANARAAMKEAAGLASTFGNLAAKKLDADRAATERLSAAEREGRVSAEDKRRIEKQNRDADFVAGEDPVKATRPLDGAGEAMQKTDANKVQIKTPESEILLEREPGHASRPEIQLVGLFRKETLPRNLSDWSKIFKHTVPESIETELAQRPKPVFVQDFEWANDWADLNLDVYEVLVKKLPLNSDGSSMTNQQLLRNIRMNFSDIINTFNAKDNPNALGKFYGSLSGNYNALRVLAGWAGTAATMTWAGGLFGGAAGLFIDKVIQLVGNTSFKAYSDDPDRIRWESDNFLGAVMQFDNLVDDLGVVASEVNDDHWIFTTVRDSRLPFLGDVGTHPVTGHRMFGFYETEQSSTVIYTRGADRTTGAMETITSPATFLGGHLIWLAWQAGIVNYVNENGGEADYLDYTSERYPYDLVAKYFADPTVEI